VGLTTVQTVSPTIFQRIGHGGASALARGNSLASFDAAIEVGVDMVEFDVRACGRELVLAHTVLHARCPGNVLLREALTYLSCPRFGDVELGVDLKHGGCERAVLEGLRENGLLSRAIICSQVVPVLDRIRALEPRARIGISIGGRLARLSCRWGDWRLGVLSGLASGRWDALLAQHRLIDSALVEEVVARDSRLYAWTVNERASIQRLRALGVHGVATADPRLFS
jgi:glycerophosphoryl diester phosphodiesterase